MSEQKELLTTSRKALRINLDEAKYGTFAEIGAGQEVAREFFQAGGASGTIAKSRPTCSCFSTCPLPIPK